MKTTERASRQRFPLRAFRHWAAANGVSAPVAVIDEEAATLPHKFRNRASTYRRGRAIELLERRNMLDGFLRSAWTYGLTEAGRREIEACRRFAERCRQA